VASDERRCCSNEGKMRNSLKVGGVSQTGKPISAVSGPKFAIFCRHVEEILLFNKFFFRIVDTALVEKIQPDRVVQWCPNGEFLAIFLRPVFSASCVQHISETTWQKYNALPYSIGRP